MVSGRLNAWGATLLCALGLTVSLTASCNSTTNSTAVAPSAAVDCDAIKAQYQCPVDQKFPLHLSFDDGPALQTLDVLDALKHERVPATFFVLAEKIDCPQVTRSFCEDAASAECRTAQQQCETRKQILARTKHEGHTIGSHSYSHLRYSGLPPQQMAEHFQASKQVLAPYLNTQPPLFRLPYGDGWFNRKEKAHVMQALDDAGFQHIAWQFSAFDWNPDNQQGDKVVANVLNQVCSRKQGGVVLFHDGVHDQLHEGRLWTTSNIGKWIPELRCVVDFKPLSFFEKGFVAK